MEATMETKTIVNGRRFEVLLEECTSPTCRKLNPWCKSALPGEKLYHIEFGYEPGGCDFGTCGPKSRILEFLDTMLSD